jgi:CRISPR-associated protein Cmx8
LARTKTKQVQAVDMLVLNYQLADLPSSQHRSGLAGLVLVIQWLERQQEFEQKVEEGAICKLTRLDDKGATLELNQVGLEALLNEIYSAKLELQDYDKPKTKGNGTDKKTVPWLDVKEVEFVDKKNGKNKTKKVYVYEDVIPKGSFLADESYDQSSDGKNGRWIKLWRDMVWSILRGVPATRKPFAARAEGIPSEDGATVWKQLVQPAEFTVDLPSTYFLGAQANNAENISFKDQARFQFLLHFWLFAAQIYVPAISKFEKNKQTNKFEEKREFVGYALAIPDVSNLKQFCGQLSKILKARPVELSGYRPRDCIVDLAVESALDIMKRLSDRLTQMTGEQSTAFSVLGIDVIHAEKQGNNVRLLSMARLNPDDVMIDKYAQIRQNFWSPLFRRQCLLNLVNHSPWYNGFDSLLCTLPYEQSIENDYFRRDVRKKIEAVIHEEDEMSETQMSKEIQLMIFQLVRNYVGRKLKSKHDLEWKADWKSLKTEELNQRQDYKDYAEKKAKIAKSAFLDIRSRTEPMDFINYFVSSLCSVPQHMKSDGFVELTQALYQDTDQIRTLTLLALSANG